MTSQAPVPACIAEALFHAASESIEQVEQEWVDYMAQAVWEALLGEGDRCSAYISESGGHTVGLSGIVLTDDLNGDDVILPRGAAS